MAALVNASTQGLDALVRVDLADEAEHHRPVGPFGWWAGDPLDRQHDHRPPGALQVHPSRVVLVEHGLGERRDLVGRVAFEQPAAQPADGGARRAAGLVVAVAQVRPGAQQPVVVHRVEVAHVRDRPAAISAAIENPCTVLVCTTSGSKASAAGADRLGGAGPVHVGAVGEEPLPHGLLAEGVRRVRPGRDGGDDQLAVVAQRDRADLVAGRGEPVAEHLGVHLGAAQDVGRPEVRDEKDAHRSRRPGRGLLVTARCTSRIGLYERRRRP